jgi:beta-glucanase (GH16 family)
MKQVFTTLFSLFFIQFFTPNLAAQCEQLVWSDEFNGTALDLSKWTPVVGPGGAVSGNAELQYYTARSQNIQVSSGTLKIIALAENYGGNAYTSARMQTKNLGDWLYGRIEARIKLPVAQGMWPAFWLLPTDNVYGNWPRSGEIDIMELIGREPSHAYATIHTSNDGITRSFGNRYDLSSGTFADDFHVFSLEWSPNLMKFYVDGNLYSTQTHTTISPYPWVFDKRFFALLNLAIGGPWAGSPDATTTFPQQMEVDYVRVYQNISSLAIIGKNLVEPNTTASLYNVPSLANTSYQWSVSGVGNTINSGQGTRQIGINWGSNSGTVSVLMNDGCTPSASVSMPVKVSANLWDNYGFEQDFVSWDTRPAYSSAVSFTVSTSDYTEGSKAASVQTNTVGANPWDIQLSRTNLSLIAGTNYTLKFKAKANANRTLPIAFIRSSNFSNIANTSINLTTNWQQYTMTFTPAGNENVMFNIDVAAQLGTNWFDDFIFARTSVLPIDLIAFKGNSEGNKNHLMWQFGDYKNVFANELEKSKNGQIFQPFMTLNPIDLTNKNKPHEAFDYAPFDQTYYRIKTVENDGKVEFSPIICVKNTDILRGPKIYPNPANDVLTIENAVGKDIEIVNILGEKMIKTKVTNNQFSMPINHLKSGIYFIHSGNDVLQFFKE